MQKYIKFIVSLPVLVIGYVVFGIIAGKISGSDKIFVFTQEEQFTAAKGMLIAALFISGILLYISKRSYLSGVKLIATIFLTNFGITVFLTHIESYIFLNNFVKILPKGSVSSMIIDNTISALLYSPFVVLLSGKIMRNGEKPLQSRLEMSVYQWFLKFIVLGIVYYVIYREFGSHVMIPIARQEAFQSYYKDLHLPVWFPLFQFFRGVIWVCIALPIISMFKGGKLELSLAVGLLFSILMGINLIIPQPFMPPQIRIAHLVELMTSNFLFGNIIVQVLMWKVKYKTEIKTNRD